MNIILRPITRWPGEMTPPGRRKPSPFEAGYGSTTELLRREVAQLGGKEIVIQIGVSEDDFKIDGGLRAHAQVRHPGVIVSFDARQGPMSYACDRFSTRGYRQDTHTAWQVNVRAVALGLEALRKIDRYDVHGDGDQYTGFKALGSGGPIAAGSGEEAMGVEQAARILLDAAGLPTTTTLVAEILANTSTRQAAYRRAASATHPDRHHGDDQAFKLVERAKRTLETT